MNILIVTTLYPKSEEQSRIEMSYAIHDFAKEWSKNGHNVKVIRLTPKFPTLLNLYSKNIRSYSKYKKNMNIIIDGVSVNIVTIKRIPKKDYSIIRKYFAFKKSLKKIESFRPDVVVCHMINPGLFISSRIKEKFNIPLILTLHQTDINQLKNMPSRLAEFKQLLPYVDTIGFRSKSLLDQYNILYPLSKEPVIINSGIDKSYIVDEKSLERKILKGKKVIFVASNMIKRKNLDIIIKAFDRIAVDKNIQLKIAGEGPEKNNLLKLIDRSKVKNKIEYLGYLDREEILSHMEECDIFTLVSSFETFGLVYLEAMAKGCITIGSKGEGIDGIIKDNYNGYLCEPRNISELVDVFHSILNLNLNKNKDIIRNAVSTAEDMTQEKMSNYYLDIIKDSINTYKTEYTRYS